MRVCLAGANLTRMTAAYAEVLSSHKNLPLADRSCR